MIYPKRATPIGQRETAGFVMRKGGCGPERLTLPVYAPSPRGEALGRMRIGLDLGLGQTARALGITAEQLSGLESGRYVLSDSEWTEAQHVVASLGQRATAGGG